MADKINPMIAAGRATGKHPQEEQYRLERAIQLEGAKDPKKFEMPGGLGTLSDVQELHEGLQRLEGEEDMEKFRQHMREASERSLNKGETVVATGAGFLLDTTVPPQAGTPVPSETESEGEETHTEETHESHLDVASETGSTDGHQAPGEDRPEGGGPSGSEGVAEGGTQQ